MDECVFCKIVKGELASNILYETENLIAVPDINPSADTHILIIPKKHIETFLDILDEDKLITSEAVSLAQRIVKEKGIEGTYRFLVNGGSLQIIKHLHFHVQGGVIHHEKLK